MKSVFLSFALLISVQILIAQDDLLNLADYYTRQSSFLEAKIVLDNYLEVYPGSALGYVKRSKVHGMLGEFQKRKSDLRMAQQINPYSLIYVDPKVRAKYIAKKKYEYTLDEFGESFTKSPIKYKYYIKIIEDLTGDEETRELLAQAVWQLYKGNITECEIFLNQIQQTDDSEGIIYDLQGLISYKKGDLEQAEEYYTKAIEVLPDYSIAYHNRSIIFKHRGQYKRAKTDLEQALATNNEISLFYFTLGKLNEKLENQKAAIEAYKMAVLLDGDYSEALVNYGHVLKGIGNYQEAVNYLNETIRNHPGKTENLFLRGNINLIYGEYDLALDDYDRYLASFPYDAGALYNRGISNILIQNDEQACLDIAKSLDIEMNEGIRAFYDAFCSQNFTLVR